MSALNKLRQRAVVALHADIGMIDSNDLETLAHGLVQIIEGRPLIQRGLTTTGRPVGYTVDSFSADQDVIIECSTEADYFEKPFPKLIADIAHARASNSNCRRLYLFSSQTCSNSNGAPVAAAVRQAAFGDCVIEWYDARRIAEALFDHVIVNDNRREFFEEFLPSLGLLFADYVFSNAAPSVPEDLVVDPQRGAAITVALATNQIVNLFDLSGAGKTYATIAFAAEHEDAFSGTFWVRGEDINDATDFRMVRLQRSGVAMNLASVLRNTPCLVVIDNCTIDGVQLKAPIAPQPGLPTYLVLLLEDCPLTANGITQLAATELRLHVDNRAALGAIIEAVERRIKLAGGGWENESLLRDAIQRLSDALPLAADPAIRADILHHRGKFRHWLKDGTGAISDFTAVLALFPNHWAALVQLARVKGDRSAGDHLRRIIDAFEKSPAAVPTTIILAALNELGNSAHAPLRNEVVRNRIGVVQTAISLSLVAGYSQPYRMLGRLGRHIFFPHPDVLLQLAGAVTFPPVEIATSDEVFDIAECLKCIGKAHREARDEPNAVRPWCLQAIPYYERVPSPNGFQLTMYAECRMLLRDFAEADQILERAPAANREAHWWHRKAQVLLGLGRADEALVALEHSLADTKAVTYLGTFLQTKARVLAAKGDPTCVESARLAFGLVNDQKHKRQIAGNYQVFTTPPVVKTVLERRDGSLTAAECKQVQEWIKELVDCTVGLSVDRAFGSWWSRLKARFEVNKYESLLSTQMPEVEAWFREQRAIQTRGLKTKAPEQWRAKRIGAIKAAMKQMNREADKLAYYREISDRLNMKRAFVSLTKLTKTDLDRVYTLVLRDAGR